MSYAALEYPAIVYKVTNLVNGNTYVGITTKSLKKRAKVHRDAAGQGRGAVIGAALRKYGKENLKFETIIACPSWTYAKEMERRCIAAFKPEYNLTSGGDGCVGYKHTEASKKHLSEAHAGAKYFLGKSHSAETKAKMSAARKAYWDSRPHSRKQRQPKLSPKRGRPVVCSNGDVYESVCHAARANGLTREQVRASLGCKKRPGFRSPQLRFTYLVWLVAEDQETR